MRLVQVQIQNFKLLEDVTLNFSTDLDRPLTVVRAENGSGKTSILYALIWAFYGSDGLAEQQGDLRLTSTAAAPGESVTVQVRVRFDHTDEGGDSTSYQLIRTVTETPGEGDKFERSDDRQQLVRFTDAGHEDVPEGLLKKLIPQRLQHVFFTNGDDVQKFISGKLSDQRQKLVHKTIKALLGLDTLRDTVEDLDACFAGVRRKTAKESGDDLETAEAALTETKEKIDTGTAELDALETRLATMEKARDSDNKELTGLRGSGDLEELNDRIAGLEADLERAEQQRTATTVQMVELLRSEAASWCFLIGPLTKGLDLLNELRDRNVIPGTSIQVLVDRLEIGRCICGEELGHGSNKRASVHALLEEQQLVDENRQRLSRLSYVAGSSATEHQQRVEDNQTFAEQRVAALRAFTTIGDVIKAKSAELDDLVERRKQVNQDRVQTLVQRIDGLDKKIRLQTTTIGEKRGNLRGFEELHAEQDEHYKKATAAAKVTQARIVEQDVASDLLTLAKGTLTTLETDYVQRVSERMQELFLEIVGSDPSFDGAVFTGTRISENYDIIIESLQGRTLDPDFELNGASQRALTLCFIWAVMQVADVTAPRIIDTPLGMVAGGVKTRLVDVISRPSAAGDPDFQVILLLTRSEIRDVEDLLDERAGVSQTLSCSKDFPADLVNDWDLDRPTVLACECGHRVACDICARRYDLQHGITRRKAEVA